MTALFDDALAVVLEHEGFGRFTDDPADPGGATRWGISLRFLRAQGPLARPPDPISGGAPPVSLRGPLAGDIDGDGDVDADDVRALTRDQAAVFYRGAFWDRYGYADFFEPRLAVKVFDLAVNMGPKAAHRCLQRALRAWGIAVVEDGILGPKTRSAVNGAHGRTLLIALRSEAAGYYRCLAGRRPALAHYLAGWLNRAYS